MQADLDNVKDEYSNKLMNLQMEHGKKLLAIERRLKRSGETVEEKEAQIARLTGATSADTSIAMAMNAKTEVNASGRLYIPNYVVSRTMVISN